MTEEQELKLEILGDVCVLLNNKRINAETQSRRALCTKYLEKAEKELADHIADCDKPVDAVVKKANKAK